MSKYTVQTGRDLLDFLIQKGLIKYGAVIDGDIIREFLDIHIPDLGSKQEFSDLALQELKAVDYVRNVLLGEGKYLRSDRGSYRILIPSENKIQCDLYISSAAKKLDRSLKLSRNTPPETKVNMNAHTVRAAMARDGVNSHRPGL